ncbi:GntR family transcriptional regulator [Psychrosphaera sp. B3R10]|uniref:GntR family transcriptional regulator n=1 Tax=unclassified Psychrosphaera TaxID=2641570 RepID=UPI001C080904|nr:GntR family transcriptional regulator [Psychrosphaera sp. 1_MG-2023]MBU2882527.1 GntR family transcriptional regulator [Psychrosphaera sp. I2R16]MBU2989455.1 GntR family transcriptional regulator [Psychrosphaera sp. B3R10]MDO6718289.1 GntR family transcriptional regulator [Psychrosphaera sp. 1_MG-2023]
MAKVVATKVSEQVAAQLEKLIIDGTYGAGSKLASERDLAAQYGVSRPSVRDAIKKLEARGIVTRKQGGGTFVCNQLDAPLAEPLFELLANSPESHYDLLEFRCALESVIAYYAALRGTDEDKKRIQAVYQTVVSQESSEDLEALAKAVVDFYLAIAEASHNVLLLHLLRGIRELILHNVKENLLVFSGHNEIRGQLSQHREKLMQAILDGEPEQARLASGQHLAFIEQSLLKLDHEHNRIQGSVRRLLSSK